MPKHSQRVPPPCWTAEETRALVVAYRDRWFSANRGSLRSPDWAAIAESLPPGGNLPKTPVQCQHKVEKLRRRYREEKRRLLENPRRLLSSWDLFPLLDSMEIGSFGSNQAPEPSPQGRSGSGEDHSDDNSGTRVSGRFDPRGSRRSSVSVDEDDLFSGLLGDSRADDRYKKVARRGFAPLRSGVNNAEEEGDDGVSPVEELARAITMSAESFVKVEEMKMEVAAEVERMRMEMELRRNEMMLDLQMKLVDSIANSLVDLDDTEKPKAKKKRKRVEMASSDCSLNGVSHCIGVGSQGIGKTG